ncbi:MAG: sporulation protein YabP [Firmicutes bacterium]|nr:sporulation protein YabP [Bacillota bacterium]
MAESRQRLLLEERRLLSLTGVKAVESFDEQLIQLDSELGGVEISGEGLQIGALDLEQGRVEVSGRIDGLSFVKSREERSVRHKSKNALARLLK